MNTRFTVFGGASITLLFTGLLVFAGGAPSASGDADAQAFEYDELRQLVADTKAERTDFIEARRILRQQLAEADTREERRALLLQFWEEHRDMILQQRALRRQFHNRRVDIRRDRRHRLTDAAAD